MFTLKNLIKNKPLLTLSKAKRLNEITEEIRVQSCSLLRAIREKQYVRVTELVKGLRSLVDELESIK